jgi:hypothetical protein
VTQNAGGGAAALGNLMDRIDSLGHAVGRTLRTDPLATEPIAREEYELLLAAEACHASSQR